MNAVKNIVNRFNRRLFDSVISNKLIYNTCWEDPRIDRQLLKIDAASNVLMLTSAGDNALDYLLDKPACVHCIDINPAQNALLELKQSLFKHGSYSLLWQVFGRGSHADITTLYHHSLRAHLSPWSQTFWDDHLDYFSPQACGGSFYYRGTSGTFASLICQRLKRKGLFICIKNLLSATSLAEQRYYYDEIEPRLWNAFLRWMIQQDATLALLGVPKTQRAIIDNEVPGGLAAYVQQAIKKVFTQRPVYDNYFWRVYLTGSYTPQCCPNYLKKSHYNSIKKNIDRLQIHTSDIINFMKDQPGPYSHFILLDHQDWLAHYQPQKLNEEWKLMLERAQPGAKILFRSAGRTRSFVPAFARPYLHFEDEQTQRLQSRDRVGTYGNTHLAIVDKKFK